ncbi:MAG: hypothetical protein K2H66_05605 [Oscillospiraceae bacterium]|nr:hypothetical protein [Oscillospiraceae bacterium]
MKIEDTTIDSLRSKLEYTNDILKNALLSSPREAVLSNIAYDTEQINGAVQEMNYHVSSIDSQIADLNQQIEKLNQQIDNLNGELCVEKERAKQAEKKAKIQAQWFSVLMALLSVTLSNGLPRLISWIQSLL